MALEIVDIRQFEAGYFQALLAAESRAWRTNLRWDYTASAQLISGCLAEKRLSGYALVSGNRIEGYSFFVYEGDKGLIGDLFVEADGAVPTGATLLLEHVIETLKATPGIERVEAQLPHFGAEQLEPCFRAHGFEMYRRNFMALSLEPGGPGGFLFAREPAVTHSEDFEIDLWERKYDRQAAQLLFNTYRGHVDAIINDQYSSVDGTTRLIENIVQMHGCGDRIPNASFLAVHRPSRKLAAVVALTAVQPHTAHVPQIAVAREFQGQGLGTLLMRDSFEEAKRQGYGEVSLTVTDLNRGAARLYERLGFETFHTFGAFVWNRRGGEDI